MTIDVEVKKQGVTLGPLLSSMRTTGASTGWRAYSGKEDKRNGHHVLVMHNEGTPSNAPLTKVYERYEAQVQFEWEIAKALEGCYPEFFTVAKYIEHI